MTKFLSIAGVATLVITQAAYAAGGFDEAPPTPTATTEDCTDGQVWDADENACVTIQDSRLDQDSLLNAARELAYADRAEDAIALLELSTMPEDTMVLTYLGFSHRKAGRIDTGMAYYDAALVADPDNILARSYMGMGYVQMAQLDMAEAQLAEIRARGGAGTWPEEALQNAIEAGDTSGYDY